MGQIETVIEGTLKPDGTLVLDQVPNLLPGRVTVVLRQESEAATPSSLNDWFEFLLNARKKLEEGGCHFMDENEMGAHVEWLREGDSVDDLLSDADGNRLAPEQR